MFHLHSARSHVLIDREHLHHQHEEKLRRVAAVIDDGVPISHQIRNRNVDGKAIMVKFVRQKIIHEENARLSDALTKIYSRDKKKQTQHYFDPELDRMRRHTQACFDHRRQVQALKNARENEFIATRLEDAPPMVGALEYQKLYDEKLGKYGSLRSRYKTKQEYRDYLAHRERVKARLLARRHRSVEQNRLLDRQVDLAVQRELAALLDPQEQSAFLSRLESEALGSTSDSRSRSRSRSASNSPSRARSASRSRRQSTSNPSNNPYKKPRATSADSSHHSPSREESRMSRIRNLEDRPEWDARPEPKSESSSPARKRAQSANSSSLRPPSRTPNKNWTNEHYVMASMGMVYRPSAEELNEQHKAAAAAILKAKQEKREAARDITAVAQRARLARPRTAHLSKSATVGSLRPSTAGGSSMLEPSLSSTQLYFAEDEKSSLSPRAREELHAQAQEQERIIAERKARQSRPSTAAMGKKNRGSTGSSAAGLRPGSATVGPVSAQLQAILFAQQRAEQLVEEEERARRQQEEIAKARQEVVAVARAQAGGGSSSTTSSSLQWLSKEDAEEYSGGKSSSFIDSAWDEDLEAPEIAPPSRPWHSPPGLPPLSVEFAKKKEAEAADDGVVPHAQPDAEGENNEEDEENKIRGKLDWEEALAEVTTPHLHGNATGEHAKSHPYHSHARHASHPRHHSHHSIHQQHDESKEQVSQEDLEMRAIRSSLAPYNPSSSLKKKSSSGQSHKKLRASINNNRRQSSGGLAADSDSTADQQEELDEQVALTTDLSVNDLKQLMGIPVNKEKKSKSRPPSATTLNPIQLKSRPQTAAMSRPTSAAMLHVAASPLATNASQSSLIVPASPLNATTSSFSTAPVSGGGGLSSSVSRQSLVGGAGGNSRPQSAMHHSGGNLSNYNDVVRSLGPHDAARFLAESTSVALLATAAYRDTKTSHARSLLSKTASAASLPVVKKKNARPEWQS